MVCFSAATSPIDLDIWGARGSRSLVPPWSKVGNNTSCYSLLQGEDVLVIDGGRGLAALAHAVLAEERFQSVKRITLVVSHAHMDHWEGLKDCSWFWGLSHSRELELEILGPSQALESIKRAYESPSFMPLEILAGYNLELQQRVLETGESIELRNWKIQTHSLNHYSGSADRKRYLDTLGLRISPLGCEPVVSYLCDHEPTDETRSAEKFLLNGAEIALIDANFLNTTDQAFGHGSQETAAKLAQSYPDILFLATHHGPGFSDEQLMASFEHHARGLSNLRLAVEGTTLRWDSKSTVFAEPETVLARI
jgi:ribonuclease BN (tRNA processing enzyme)